MTLAFGGTAHAQQTVAELNQQLGECRVYTGAKRAQCFEKLATDALQHINNAGAAKAAPQPPSYPEVEDAKKRIGTMFGGQSVRLRNVFFTHRDTKSFHMCGEYSVMDKSDKFGSFTPFMRFMLHSDVMPSVETPESTTRFGQIYPLNCSNVKERVPN